MTACSWFEGTCERRYSVGAIGELQQICVGVSVSVMCVGSDLCTCSW